MKFLSVILFVVFGFSSAWAESTVETSRITYEMGSGRSYDNCREPFFSCIDRTKRDAQQRAIYDAENRCRMNRGRISGGASCNTNCSPNMIPPNSPPTFVTCDSRCTVRCEIN